jgi:hypothetical protein
MTRLFIFLLFSISAHAAAPVDVVVYGATPAGVCAAIAAAREGASVVLLEPTGHVGGMNTGGLCFSDSNQTVRSTMLGLFEEWHQRIEAAYQARGVHLPYTVSEKNNAHWTYEPHVAARITQEMLDEAHVRVLTRHRLQSATKDGARVTKLITSGGEWEAKTYIDCTYEGDLLAAAHVSWTIGREGRNAFGESFAGKQYPKPKINISGMGTEGKPLPLITTTDAGPEEEGDEKVMVYSFRLCVTKDPANREPFPKPDRYDPERFEVVRRYYRQAKKLDFPWDLYPLPGNKFDANNGIFKQFSMGAVGVCNGWSQADEKGRAEIWEAHRQYTLEFYHFITTDDSVPESIRAQMLQLGLCRDEFTDTKHWSPQLYVREGRRMIGEYVVSQNDILKQAGKEDPIAVSSFPIDSHDCQRVGTQHFVWNEGTIGPLRMQGRRHGYPYHIPYRAITPKAAECTNLLVPVALSCTHVGLCSIRVEPTWMVLGQSAGIAAALSAKHGVAVQKLSYDALQKRLSAQKIVLDLPVLGRNSEPSTTDRSGELGKLPAMVLDDTQAELRGPWSHSTRFKPHTGAGYHHDEKRGDGTCEAVFRCKVPHTGSYQLQMAYSAHETRATRVPVTVRNGGTTVELLVDQTLPIPAGTGFRSIGKVQLQKEVETTITVRNAGTNGFVILDALQLVAE